MINFQEFWKLNLGGAGLRGRGLRWPMVFNIKKRARHNSVDFAANAIFLGSEAAWCCFTIFGIQR